METEQTGRKIYKMCKKVLQDFHTKQYIRTEHKGNLI
jgi:hypothetical protein